MSTSNTCLRYYIVYTLPQYYTLVNEHHAGFVQCPELTSTIENGEVAIIPDNRPVNSKATYMCDSNYELEGIGARYCQLDGTWNGTAPKCSTLSLCMCSMFFLSKHNYLLIMRKAIDIED